jgi:hypothetical protein
MASMTNEERHDLLLSLRSDAGQAEGASGRTGQNFFPIPEHLRALEPDVVLVVGDRGAGKSQLVAVAADSELRKAVMNRKLGLRLVGGDAPWKMGYPMHDAGPGPAGWQTFVVRHQPDIKIAAQEVWFAYLVRVLGELLPKEDIEKFRRLLDAPGAEVEERYSDFQRAGSSPLVALDNLNKKLLAEDRWVFVLYDELDTLYYSDWWAMGALIRGLISFWANYHRRWSRIRPKIFLRTDFYRHHGSDVAGADMVKLAAARVELTWSDRNLYAALLKHIINLSKAWFAYCARGKGDKARYEKDAVFRYVPVILKKEDARPVVERIVGPHMGASKDKGQSFFWILDHLRDGNGKVSPRSLILLFENAAVMELATPRASGAQVLSHISLRNALDKVSEAHVTNANNEFPWLPMVKQRLKVCREVPWESRRTLEIALGAHWEGWVGRDSAERPPADSPKELVDVLLELGIVRDRGHDNYDVPDLYQEGLGLVRRGGVARGKRRSAR